MSQTLLNAVLVLAMLYIVYECLYSMAFNCDHARRMVRHNTQLQRGTATPFHNPPNAFIRVWPHTFMRVCFQAGLMAGVVWQVLQCA